ncbi:MAG TPA: hypothetical protein VMX76_00290 [Nevskiaceae bacterium]|nr:hypothetical protein [Nevskiaceae bacterium]
MNNKNKKTKFKLGKDALILSIMTLLTVITWIFFEVYRTLRKQASTQITKKQMESLDPKINTTIIQSLKENLSFSNEELNIVPTPTPTETVTTSTESAIME